MKIRTKEEFQQLSRCGLLGNTLRSWDTVQALRHDYRGFVTIRARDKQSPWFVSETHSDNLEGELALIDVKGGPGAGAFYFQEIPPPGTVRRCNVELMPEAGGLTGYIEPWTVQPVRGIRERVAPVSGLTAKLWLDHLLSAASTDTLHGIWD